MHVERSPLLDDHEVQEWFRMKSLGALAVQLQNHPYSQYARYNRLYLPEDAVPEDLQGFTFQDGPWETSPGEAPSSAEQSALLARGSTLDSLGRPLHPWARAMLTDPNIGVLTGKGFYREWGGGETKEDTHGRNTTADAIMIRRDRGPSMVMLGLRADTNLWGIPGGFVDPTDAHSLAAAVREVEEEAQRKGDDRLLNPTVPVSEFIPKITRLYHGPVADVRLTVNAYPVTTAYVMELNDDDAQDLPLGPYPCADKDGGIKHIRWADLETLETDNLFGSHGILLDMAKRELGLDT